MTSDAPNTTPPPPSLMGQLNTASFMFTTANPIGVRRSPRHSTPTAASAIPTSAPIPAPDLAASHLRPAAGPAHSRSRGSVSPSKPATTTSHASASSSPAKSPRKRQKSSGYAPPSTYAHLPLLPDAIAPNLLVLFVGLNPGIQTARTGHAYAHPTNLFWRLLHSSGVTPRLCMPAEDRSMPALYSLGQTNIVARPSRNGAELSKAEMDAGVALLEAKARRWRPETMCVVGKSIWESLWRVRHGRAIKAHEFRYGWQDESENMGVIGEGGRQREDEFEGGVDYSGEWKGARVFVASSTSGLAATLKPAEKEAIWRELGAWVEKRREERSIAAADS
ncbi:uracil-DNA glycosylase-like protein [Lasiosphaeris hirsuta]|uniref:Uracil-DNA glycosylase-like protein n=1 Tax=Lasiosphaeris hirsuta TaxID=260670 RepID=A0AA40BBW6_9PEZI|nr:uracil-DNA glycosylase-like protein [Lasiosphaeris hirsuta]